MAQPAVTTVYEIKILERIQEKWTEWFNDFLVCFAPGEENPEGTTLLVTLPDQAALRGVLNKLWDLNLSVVSVNRQDEIHGLREPGKLPHTARERVEGPGRKL